MGFTTSYPAKRNGCHGSGSSKSKSSKSGSSKSKSGSKH